MGSLSVWARILPEAAGKNLTVQISPRSDAYSPREIALAAGVSVEQVAAIVGQRSYISYAEALSLGRALAHQARVGPLSSSDRHLFSIFSAPASHLPANYTSMTM